MINRNSIGLLAAAALAAGVIVVTGCSKSNPVNSSQWTLDTTNRAVFWNDPTFADSSLYSVTPFKLDLNDTITKLMTFNSTIGYQSLGSMYSTANNQAQEYDFPNVQGDQPTDSIVGMEFYLMAKSSAKTNFIAFLGKNGGSVRNSAYYVGMGFDKSDSVKYVYSTALVAGEEKSDISAMQFNKWYRCTVEFRFQDMTATYYLDGVKVGTYSLPGTFGFNMLIVYRDGNGQNGMAPYYLNDLTLYKINKKQ
jgi:hypothetical protein